MDLSTLDQKIVAIRYAYLKNVFHSFQTQISVSHDSYFVIFHIIWLRVVVLSL